MYVHSISLFCLPLLSLFTSDFYIMFFPMPSSQSLFPYTCTCGSLLFKCFPRFHPLFLSLLPSHSFVCPPHVQTASMLALLYHVHIYRHAHSHSTPTLTHFHTHTCAWRHHTHAGTHPQSSMHTSKSTYPYRNSHMNITHIQIHTWTLPTSKPTHDHITHMRMYTHSHMVIRTLTHDLIHLCIHSRSLPG